MARRSADGSFTSAVSIELGLRPALVDVLGRQLASLATRRRGAVTWYPPMTSVVASCHGLPDGPVRDAVLRAVVVA